jgi:hypothetical protein
MTVFNAAFKRWFGDSKVVDDQGRPLVVYHQTHWEHHTFDRHYGTRKFGRKPERIDAIGLWFTDTPFDPQGAALYGPITMPAYLSISNPIVYHDEWKDPKKGSPLWHQKKQYVEPGFVKLREVIAVAGGADAFYDAAVQNGFDGVAFPDTHLDLDQETTHNVFVAFHPTQIKSVYNAGTWSPDDPDIRRNPRRRR